MQGRVWWFAYRMVMAIKHLPAFGKTARVCRSIIMELMSIWKAWELKKFNGCLKFWICTRSDEKPPTILLSFIWAMIQAILSLNSLGLKNIRSRTIWANVNSIWHLRQMILTWRIKSTKKWVVAALKILKWVSISSRTRTAIGWKFCRN